jgi:restriction endonuclease Mrr
MAFQAGALASVRGLNLSVVLVDGQKLVELMIGFYR